MYMLINNGKHPFYTKEETKKTYLEKIKKCKLTFTKGISYMCLNMFSKLLEPDKVNRYTIERALEHPWITRRVLDPIPMTHLEDFRNRQLSMRFKKLIGVVILLNSLRKPEVVAVSKGYIDRLKIYSKQNDVIHISNQENMFSKFI